MIKDFTRFSKEQIVSTIVSTVTVTNSNEKSVSMISLVTYTNSSSRFCDGGREICVVELLISVEEDIELLRRRLEVDNVGRGVVGGGTSESCSSVGP